MPTVPDVGRPSLRRGDWSTVYCQVTAGQTFKMGDPVYRVEAGTISLAALNGSSDIDASACRVLGFAGADAADCLTQSGDFALCPVDVPGENAEFVVFAYHSTAASAVLALTDMGVGTGGAPITLPLHAYGTAPNYQWGANVETNGTDDTIVITERHPKYPYSEQYGWFWARWMTSMKSFTPAT